MNRREFSQTGFFFGIQAMIDGEWYRVVSADFDDFTVDIDVDENSEYLQTIRCEDIEEFSRLTKESQEDEKDD